MISFNFPKNPLRLRRGRCTVKKASMEEETKKKIVAGIQVRADGAWTWVGAVEVVYTYTCTETQ